MSDEELPIPPKEAVPHVDAPPPEESDCALDKAVVTETSVYVRHHEEPLDSAATEALKEQLEESLTTYAAQARRPVDVAAIKARNRRNLAIALALVAFAILVFISTLVHLGGGATPQP
ncbi:MAG TPA: hypothetical protein VGL66_09500 [Caulobacteraceae bacterium]|jgi:hypothetical protein